MYITCEKTDEDYCVGDEEFPEPDEADTIDGGSLHSEQTDRDDENAYDGKWKIVGFIAILKVLQDKSIMSCLKKNYRKLVRKEYYVTELLYDVNSFCIVCRKGL